jgi:hypothetical protein
MRMLKAGLLWVVVGAVFAGAAGPGRAAPGDSLIVVMDRGTALSDPLYRDLPAFEVSADHLMLVIPEEEAGRSPILGSAVSLGGEPFPLWVTSAAISEEEARSAGVTILFREGGGTVISASEDAAYGLLARGYFVVRVEFHPLADLAPAAWREHLVGEMLQGRPMDAVRRGFLRGVADSVDTTLIKSALYFLEYDEVHGHYRSRFQARPEMRQVVVPYIEDALESRLGPYGGDISGQAFVQRLGGTFACREGIPCDTIFVNVIGEKPGRKTSAYYIICAHYDAIAINTPGWSDEWYEEDVPAPGADDNGTGVASVLECARLLAPLDLDVGVKFITFAGEEPGLLGSKYYAGHLAPDDSVIAVINFDMVGYVDQVPLLEIVYDWKSKWISDQLAEVAEALDLDSAVELVDLTGVADSDHASFWQVGIPGNMLIEELETIGEARGGPVNPYYHSLEDTLGHLRMDLVGDAVRMVTGMIARFAVTPGESLSDIDVTPGSVAWDWPGRTSSLPLTAGDSLSARLRALNLGAAMEEPRPYTFEIWRGGRDTGTLIHRSTSVLDLLQGEYTDLESSWRTSPERYGGVAYTFVLLPEGEDVESDLTNNTVRVELEVLPQEVVLGNVHVTPNPVTFSGGGRDSLRFEVLHPEGDFDGIVDVWIYDIVGTLVGQGSLRKSAVVKDFRFGENSVDLGRFLSGPLGPGLYVGRARLRLFGEAGTYERTFRFAVDR